MQACSKYDQESTLQGSGRNRNPARAGIRGARRRLGPTGDGGAHDLRCLPAADGNNAVVI